MEDSSHIAKYIKILKETPKIKYYVIWKGTVPAALPSELKGRVFTWNEFIAFGEKKYNLLYSATNLRKKKIISKFVCRQQNRATARLLSIHLAQQDHQKLL